MLGVEKFIQNQCAQHMRAISVTSGKGGVGKSNIVVNLAIALEKIGKKILIVDGDFSLANIDILLNLKSQFTVKDVIQGRKSMSSILIHYSPGVHILPATSGILSMNELSNSEKICLKSCLEELQFEYDYILIDTAAGINSDVLWLNSIADEVIIVTTTEPTAITDAYAMIKVLNQNYRIKKFKLLVNQVQNPSEGLKVYKSISDVIDRFLNIGIDYIGCIVWDPCLPDSVKLRSPLMINYPNSKSADNFRKIAKEMEKDVPSQLQYSRSSYFLQSIVGNA